MAEAAARIDSDILINRMHMPYRLEPGIAHRARIGLVVLASDHTIEHEWRHMLDIDGFIARVGDYLEKNGFFEREIARRTEQFGHIAHVWSTYESRYTVDDPEPFMRGINSIQLFYDGTRWWIVTIYWQHESTAHPIPAKYL